MKEAENEDGEGKRKVESLWPRIHRMPFLSKIQSISFREIFLDIFLNPSKASFQNSSSTVTIHL